MCNAKVLLQIGLQTYKASISHSFTHSAMYTHIQLYSRPITGLSGHTATLQQGPSIKNNMRSFMYNIICIFTIQGYTAQLQYLIKKVHVLSCDSSTTHLSSTTAEPCLHEQRDLCRMELLNIFTVMFLTSTFLLQSLHEGRARQSSRLCSVRGS